MSSTVLPDSGCDTDSNYAEDNELSFPDGAQITNLVGDMIQVGCECVLTVIAQEFPDEDWWLGEFGGKSGLFPANYVQLDQ